VVTDKVPNLKELLKQEDERLLDKAEDKLIELIEKGDSTMIKYFLSTKGKERGYVDASEQAIRSSTVNITFGVDLGKFNPIIDVTAKKQELPNEPTQDN
jgi:hypothetical protein